MFKLPPINVDEYWIVEIIDTTRIYRTVVKVYRWDWMFDDWNLEDDDTCCNIYYTGSDISDSITHKEYREQNFPVKFIKKLDLYD